MNIVKACNRVILWYATALLDECCHDAERSHIIVSDKGR